MFRKKTAFMYLDTDNCAIVTAAKSQQYPLPKSVSAYGTILDWNGYSAALTRAVQTISDCGLQLHIVLAPHSTYVFRNSDQIDIPAIAAIIPIPDKFLRLDTLSYSGTNYTVFTDNRLLATVADSFNKHSISNGGVFAMSLQHAQPPETVSYQFLQNVCDAVPAFTRTKNNTSAKKGLLNFFS